MPPVKLVDAGRVREDILGWIMNQVRDPLVGLDVKGQIAALNTGRRRIVELELDRVGTRSGGDLCESDRVPEAAVVVHSRLGDDERPHAADGTAASVRLPAQPPCAADATRGAFAACASGGGQSR